MSTGDIGDRASFRNGSLRERVDTGVRAVVEAREVAREILLAAAAPAAPLAAGYGGGAVATESGRGNGSLVDNEARPAAMGMVEGAWVCVTASRYGGATSSSTLWMLGVALWADRAPLRWLPVSLLRRLLLLENRPPISSSASNENMRRCRDHFFGNLCRFSDIEAGADCRLFRRRRQKKASATMSKDPTTTGTAIAACSPGLHDILLQDVSALDGFSPLEALLTPELVDSGTAAAVVCEVGDVVEEMGVDDVGVESVCVAEAAAVLLLVGRRVPVVCSKLVSKDCALAVKLLKSPPPTVKVARIPLSVMVTVLRPVGGPLPAISK